MGCFSGPELFSWLKEFPAQFRRNFGVVHCVLHLKFFVIVISLGTCFIAITRQLTIAIVDVSVRPPTLVASSFSVLMRHSAFCNGVGLKAD